MKYDYYNRTVAHKWLRTEGGSRDSSLGARDPANLRLITEISFSLLKRDFTVKNSYLHIYSKPL